MRKEMTKDDIMKEMKYDKMKESMTKDDKMREKMTKKRGKR